MRFFSSCPLSQFIDHTAEASEHHQTAEHGAVRRPEHGTRLCLLARSRQVIFEDRRKVKKNQYLPSVR